jgi:hypothetical protein
LAAEATGLSFLLAFGTVFFRATTLSHNLFVIRDVRASKLWSTSGEPVSMRTDSYALRGLVVATDRGRDCASASLCIWCCLA